MHGLLNLIHDFGTYRDFFDTRIRFFDSRWYVFGASLETACKLWYIDWYDPELVQKICNLIHPGPPGNALPGI